MTLLHTRTEPAPVVTRDAEALIREARRLRRRRWTVGLLVAAVVGAGIGWAVAAGSHAPSHPAKRVPRLHVIRGVVRPGLPEGPYAHLKVAGPLAVGRGGSLYVADVDREQVLVRLSGGRFRTVAGNGTKGVSGDGGPAIDAQLVDIEDMTVAPDGSLYIVDGDRVRVVSPQGVISTVAGLPGMGTPCCSSVPPPPIASGTPALTVSIDQMNSAAIALSEQGVLYISTGMQLLRLDSGLLDVVPTHAVAPPFDGEPLGELGQIAVDAQGNVDVSGGGGWAIWRLAPDGTTTEITTESYARRSGGDTSVLERAPDGAVYGESGPTFLKLQAHGVISRYSFPAGPRTTFWLTYFVFGPSGRIFADEIPGNGGFERYQQLRVVRGDRSKVLWQQTPADVARVAP